MTTAESTQKKPKREAKPYVHPYVAGVLLGLVLFGSFFLTGNGLGASGGLNRFIVFFEDLIAQNAVTQRFRSIGQQGLAAGPCV